MSAPSYYCDVSTISPTKSCCIHKTIESNLHHLDLDDPAALVRVVLSNCFPSCNLSDHHHFMTTIFHHLWHNNNTGCEAPPETDNRCFAKVSPAYVAYMLFLCVVLTTALLGNLMVIVTIAYTRNLRRLSNSFFILSLAVSDLLATMTIIPVKLHTAYHNLHFCASLALCHMYVTSDIVLFAASITNLFVLTIDRFVALQYTFTYIDILNRKRVKRIIALIWSYALMWGVAANFYWSNPHGRRSVEVSGALQCVCSNKYFVIVVFVVVFYVPSLVMGYFYAKIFAVARKHVKVIRAVYSNLRSNSVQATHSSALTGFTPRASVHATSETHGGGKDEKNDNDIHNNDDCDCDDVIANSHAIVEANGIQQEKNGSVSRKNKCNRKISVSRSISSSSGNHNNGSCCNSNNNDNNNNNNNMNSKNNDHNKNNNNDNSNDNSNENKNNNVNNNNNDNNSNSNNNNATVSNDKLTNQTNNFEQNDDQYYTTRKISQQSLISHHSIQKKSADRSGLLKVTKTVCIVYGCFMLCWFPVSVLAVGIAWGSGTSFQTEDEWPHVVVAEILPVLNSTMNPFIYSLTNKKYRKAFYKVLNDARNALRTYWEERKQTWHRR